MRDGSLPRRQPASGDAGRPTTGALIYANAREPAAPRGARACGRRPVPADWLDAPARPPTARSTARVGPRTFELLAGPPARPGVHERLRDGRDRRSGRSSSSPTRTRTRSSGSRWDGVLVYANPASRRADRRARRDDRRAAARAAGVASSMAAAVAGNGERSSSELRTATTRCSPVDVPEFGFINVYGTDITAVSDSSRPRTARTSGCS